MYEDKFTGFRQDFQNREVYTNTSQVQIIPGYPGMGGPNYQTEIHRNREGKNFMVGVSTGRTMVYGGFVYLQIVGAIGSDGWGCIQMLYVDQSRGAFTGKASDKDAQNLINSIIFSNKIILENNLLCAGLLKKLDAKGIAVSNDMRQQLAYLQDNLQSRNKRIMNSSLLRMKKEASPQGFSIYAKDLEDFMGDPFNEGLRGIGAIPLLAVIAVSALVTVLLGWIVYLIFKPDYTDSKADLKVSTLLTKALATLSPDERNSVLNDLEGQIDKAYVNGKFSSSMMGKLKTIGYMAAGLLLLPVISNLGESVDKTTKRVTRRK